MKNLILIAMITFLGFSAQAQTKKNKNLKYTTEVNGNCEQCKKRIEKAAYRVKMASWDINTHQLSVILNEEKSSPADLNKAIAKVGHDTKEVKATQEDYDNLHSCCKYERG
jgi:cation transport ATPase